jgi:hypothetical protein|nr:MAG: trehalose utilization [Pseudomonadota bacterium]
MVPTGKPAVRAWRRVRAALLLLLIPMAAMNAASPERLPVMILDGESNPWHEWRASTPMLRRMLEETGRFEVTVLTAPPDADFSRFDPDFNAFAAVVLNYDAPDGRWPPALQRRFEDYVRGGGGLVLVHAANNAFPGWREFNRMAGIGGWRDRDAGAGPWWYVDEEGVLVSDASSGPTGSHGRRIPFEIVVRTDHPVTRGLPPRWLHAADELYAHLRGPGENMTVLATAWSDPANLGSGRHEPQLLVVSYGRGRVFHTTLGHDPVGLASADFVVTFQRGTEWAASGEVTLRVPAGFPGTDQPLLREDLLALAESPDVRGQP